MPSSREVTLFHAPQTRSTGALTLLEELGADYRLQVLDLKAGQQRDPAAYSTSPYGDFDAVLGALTAQLARGPYFLGARFTAVDVLWGQALRWILQFGLVPRVAPFVDYVARLQERPAFVRAAARDAELSTPS